MENSFGFGFISWKLLGQKLGTTVGRMVTGAFDYVVMYHYQTRRDDIYISSVVAGILTAAHALDGATNRIHETGNERCGCPELGLLFCNDNDMPAAGHRVTRKSYYR